MLRLPQLNEVVSTDPIFAKVRSIEGCWMAQMFFGCGSKFIAVHGMKTESDFPDIYKDFLKQKGIPHTLRRDNAKSENSQAVKEINRECLIRDQFTEPNHPQQNPVEGQAIKFLKS